MNTCDWKYRRDQVFCDSDNPRIARDVKYKDRLSKQFTNYQDMEHLISIVNDYPYLYECITPNIRQKIYFDIDGIQGHYREDELLDHITSVIRSCIISFDLTIRRDWIDIRVYSSSDNVKLSYHIVVANVYVATRQENKEFCTLVSNRVDKKYRDLIDTGVYDHCRQFRILGCRKYGSNRVKKCLFNGRWTDPLTIDPEIYANELRKSLISYQSSDYKLVRIPVRQVIKPVQVLDVDMQKVYDDYLSFAQESGMPVMETRTVRSNIMILNRISRGYCICCDREHDADNAYISISSTGDYYYVCYRSGSIGKRLIGRVNEEVTEQDMSDLL